MNLTGNELGIAKRWLATVFYAGDLVKTFKDYFRGSVKKVDAKAICEEIKFRNWTFITKNLDNALRNLSVDSSRYNKIHTENGGWVGRSTEVCAQYIAWFCQTAKITWDDSLKTKYEIDAIKDTILGKALYEAGCFMHSKPQQAKPVQNTAGTTAGTTKTRSTATKQPGQPPQSGYKASGGHSKDIPNLVSNGKVNLSGPVYCITADKVGKNTPRAFITPLAVTGNTIRIVNTNNAEKIKFGSGNGYTDCTLFFDNASKATLIKSFCQSQFGNKFNNFTVVVNKNADKNGYFQVSTEQGYAYIKASVLNEELEEDLTEEISSTDKINDIEVYHEWMQKSIS